MLNFKAWCYFENRLVKSFISSRLTQSSAFPHQAFPKRWSSWWRCTVDWADRQLKLPVSFCSDFQPGLLQSSPTTPWCSAPSAALTVCSSAPPYFPVLWVQSIPIHPSLSLVRPPSIPHVTFVMDILRLGFWCGYFFLLAGIAQLAGIAHIFRIRSRISKYHSSLSVPKCSCYCWEHCVTTAPPHALGWISSVLFGCQLNTSSSGSPSHTFWPWGAVLCVSQSQSWFPRAVDHMVCFWHVCHFPQEQRPWWKESCLQCLVCDS